MEIVNFIVLLLILTETTVILVKNGQKSFRKTDRPKVYVDTSALIDGRILAVAETGFLGYDMVIPRSVIRELQLLADGKDPEKRARARSGLDLINELERVVYFDLEILEDELDRTPVDDRLLELAKKNHGLILTVDFNLIKVAKAEGIETLNVNDLATVLKSEFSPGEKYKLKITGKGNNEGQGVGYLPDGTMVVVEGAERKVGQEVKVEFVRFFQTPAGRIMFARLYRPSLKR